MSNRYQRWLTHPPDDAEVLPYTLVMVGDMTVLSEYALLRGIKVERIRKLVQRRREGTIGRRKPILNDFPGPVKSFRFFDVYLRSSLDEFFISDGTLRREDIDGAESEEVQGLLHDVRPMDAG